MMLIMAVMQINAWTYLRWTKDHAPTRTHQAYGDKIVYIFRTSH